MGVEQAAVRGGAVDPDREDAARLRRGDTAGLAGLMVRHQDRLFRYLLRLLGEEAVAEDMFQQTWLKVAERVSRYDGARPFGPWLFAVARNLALDHLRRRRPESLDDVDEPAAPGADPSEHAVARRAEHAARGRGGVAGAARPGGAVPPLRGGPGPPWVSPAPWGCRCRRRRRGSTGRSPACAGGSWPGARRRSGHERPRDRPDGPRRGGPARSRRGSPRRGASARVCGLRERGFGVAPPGGGPRAPARPAAVARPRGAHGRGGRGAPGREDGARLESGRARVPGRVRLDPGRGGLAAGGPGAGRWRCRSEARWRPPPRGTRPTWSSDG